VYARATKNVLGGTLARFVAALNFISLESPKTSSNAPPVDETSPPPLTRPRAGAPRVSPPADPRLAERERVDRARHLWRALASGRTDSTILTIVRS
jgi:hypothetical protein